MAKRAGPDLGRLERGAAFLRAPIYAKQYIIFNELLYLKKK